MQKRGLGMEGDRREGSVDNLRKAAKRRLALRLAQKTVKSYRRVRRLPSTSSVSGATSKGSQNTEVKTSADSRDADFLEEYDEGPPEAAAGSNGNAVKGQNWGADWLEDDQEKSQSNKRLAMDEDVQEELACMIGTDTDVRYYQRPTKDILEAREIRDQPGKSKPQVDESRATDVIPLLSKPAKSAEEKFRVLDARDKLIRIQKTQAEGKQLKKKQSGNIGTCSDMCPEKERYERIARQQVEYYESNRDTKEVNLICMVKRYARSSADQPMPLQHDLRPGKVLWMTMSYLVNKLMDLVDVPGENLGEWYHFLWDRTRSVRKDIAQLELCDQQSVLIMEICARFHIFCMERLREEKMAVFDEKINRENLTKCLQSLQYMYSDLRHNKNECCPNEPEFQAYSILLHINSDLCTSTILSLSQEMLQNEKVHFAVQIYLAVSSRNYVSFFKLVKSTTYLNACILHQYFAQVRAHAMRSIIQAFSRQKMRNTYPLYELQKQLLFDSAEDVLEFCRVSNVPVVEDTVILDKTVLKPIPMQEKMKRSYVGVEYKRTCSVKEIVAGGPVPLDISVYHRVHNSFNADDILKTQAWYAEDQCGFIENEEQLPKMDFTTSTFTDASAPFPNLPSSTSGAADFKHDIPKSESRPTSPPSITSSVEQEQNYLKNTQVFSDLATTKVSSAGNASGFFKSAIAQSKVDNSSNIGQPVLHQASPLSEARNVPSIFGGSSLLVKPSQEPPGVPSSQSKPRADASSDFSKPEKTVQRSSEESSPGAFTFASPTAFVPTHPPLSTAASFTFSFTSLSTPATTTFNSTFKSPTNTLFNSGMSSLKPSSENQFWTPVVSSASETVKQISASASTLPVSQQLAKPDTSFRFVFDQKPSAFDQKPSGFDQKPSLFDQKPSVFDQKPMVSGTFPSQSLQSQYSSPVFTSVQSSPPAVSFSQNNFFQTTSVSSIFPSQPNSFITPSTTFPSVDNKPTSAFQRDSAVVSIASPPSSTIFPATEVMSSTPKPLSTVTNLHTTPSMFESVTPISVFSNVSVSKKDIFSTEDTGMYVSVLKKTSSNMKKLSESESMKSSNSSLEEMDSEDDVAESSDDLQEEISPENELPEVVILSSKHLMPPHFPDGPTAAEMEAIRYYRWVLLSRAFHRWRTFSNRCKLKRRIEIHDSSLLSGYEHRLSMPPGCEVVDHRIQLDYTINAEEIGSEAFRTVKDIRRIKVESMLIDSLTNKGRIDSNVFWKLVISLPDETEAGTKYSAYILHWADRVFADEVENRKFQRESDILRMSFGRINGAENVVTAVRRFTGQIHETSTMKGVNGVLFFTPRAVRNVQQCHTRFQEIVKANIVEKAIPMVVIVGASQWKPICREWLIGAMEREEIIDYRMIGPLDVWEEPAMQKVEGSIRWLAGHSKPYPPLAGYSLKDILLNFNDDLWVRVRFTLAGRCSSASQQHPQDLLDLYHEALKRLQKMLKNDCVDEFVDIAPEFEEVLHHNEFCEQNIVCKTLMSQWKERNYIKKVNEVFQRTRISMELPPDENLNLYSFCKAYCISYPNLRGIVNPYICIRNFEDENADWVYVTKLLTSLHISHVMENLDLRNLVGVFSKSEIFKFCTEPWYRSWLKDRFQDAGSPSSLGEMETSISLDNNGDDLLEVSELSELSDMSKVLEETDPSEDILAKFGQLLDEVDDLDAVETQEDEESFDIDMIEKKLNDFEDLLMQDKPEKIL